MFDQCVSLTSGSLFNAHAVTFYQCHPSTLARPHMVLFDQCVIDIRIAVNALEVTFYQCRPSTLTRSHVVLFDDIHIHDEVTDIIGASVGVSAVQRYCTYLKDTSVHAVLKQTKCPRAKQDRAFNFAIISRRAIQCSVNWRHISTIT